MRSAFLLLLVLTLGLGACGGGDSEEPVSVFERLGIDVTGGPPTVEADATVTATGLQIIVFDVGDGDSVAPGSTFTVEYTGWLSDGTLFWSTILRGEPETLQFERVIPGWQEGLEGMRAGGTRRLIIPSALAYGEDGWDPYVPPNAELTYDIELIGVE